MAIYLIKKHNSSLEAILFVQATQGFVIQTNLGSHYSSLSSNYDQLLLNCGKEGKSALSSIIYILFKHFVHSPAVETSC